MAALEETEMEATMNMMKRMEQLESSTVKSADEEPSAQHGDKIKVIYYLRDIKRKMVDEWKQKFRKYEDRVKSTEGDIFVGTPEVDAVVSPANAFGFMDGGIDRVFSELFGWQMQERIQKVIRDQYDGENFVGNAIIIPAYDKDPDKEHIQKLKTNNISNGKPIKYLIHVPTMRVPKDVINSTNAYLSFRGVILAVQKHNRNPENQPIRRVLCPGLGTAVGRMPFNRCAFQMVQAFEIFDLRLNDKLMKPDKLWDVRAHDKMMQEYNE
ncbi:uncharacterized protein aq_987-like [Mytilus galloprovincialis]|uniref:uncharacterized protein aq_987-like n=1 Tax=Mytilus galloprovincialis TaxID=29158 RepID=UPI003F7BAB72